MRRYQEIMENFHLPERVEEQVLASGGRTEQRKQPGAAILRRAVCAACALALVLGSFSLRWESSPVGNIPGSGSGAAPGTLVLSYEFGIAAGAVENAANGGLIFRWEDEQCGFRVVGEDIAAITLETDRGVLLRNNETMGSSLTESYDPEAVYGIAPADGEDLKSLDGVELLLTVNFTDGTEKTESYHLTAEELRAFTNEDGQEVLVPTLEGDPGEKIPALYTTGESSRWLSWPVSGSNTVSLSQEFGGRVPPGGGEPLFHAGIDIPGEQGADIAAAAAGMVIEAGFNPERGNYLVLDHGDGLTTLYGQCQELLAAEGDGVEAGEVIALLGSTGKSTGPHLHFEVRQGGEAQNPVAYFDRAVRDTLQAK